LLALRLGVDTDVDLIELTPCPPTLRERLVALLPKTRRSAILRVGAVGVLFVVVSLAGDRSVRQAMTSWPTAPAPPAEHVAPRHEAPRPIAPVRALALAPMTPPAAKAEATPAPAEAPAPTPHPHRRAKKHAHKGH
jgi:hypothetical protein